MPIIRRPKQGEKGFLQKLLDWLTTIKGIVTTLTGIVVAFGALLFALKDHLWPDGEEHSRIPSPTLYEDLNDHDHLRLDPFHGLIAGKSDPLGQDRIQERDKGKALAAYAERAEIESVVATQWGGRVKAARALFSLRVRL